MVQDQSIELEWKGLLVFQVLSHVTCTSNQPRGFSSSCQRRAWQSLFPKPPLKLRRTSGDDKALHACLR